MQNSSSNSTRPQGRAEISDPATFDRLQLRLSADAMQEIRQFEERLIMAEQRLGTFRVG